MTEGPDKCPGCECRWFDDICFTAHIHCMTDGGCLTAAWAHLDPDGDMPRPLQKATRR